MPSIEGADKGPAPRGIPWYLLNRNKDMETGKNIHIVSNDLIFNTRQDVSRDVANGTWRGLQTPVRTEGEGTAHQVDRKDSSDRRSHEVEGRTAAGPAQPRSWRPGEGRDQQGVRVEPPAAPKK